jgi:hypothetical protein
MAIPVPGHMCSWKLEPQDEEEAFKLNNMTVKFLETINVELAVAMAEFSIEVAGETGAILNNPDFLLLRGRRSLVLELLDRYDSVMGQSAAPTQEAGDGSFQQV